MPSTQSIFSWYGMTSEEALKQARTEGLTLKRSRSKTGYSGVTLKHPGYPKPYAAQVFPGGKTVTLGSFATAEEAALCIAQSRKGKEPDGRLAPAARAPRRVGGATVTVTKVAAATGAAAEREAKVAAAAEREAKVAAAAEREAGTVHSTNPHAHYLLESQSSRDAEPEQPREKRSAAATREKLRYASALATSLHRVKGFLSRILFYPVRALTDPVSALTAPELRCETSITRHEKVEASEAVRQAAAARTASRRQRHMVGEPVASVVSQQAFAAALNRAVKESFNRGVHCRHAQLTALQRELALKLTSLATGALQQAAEAGELDQEDLHSLLQQPATWAEANARWHAAPPCKLQRDAKGAVSLLAWTRTEKDQLREGCDHILLDPLCVYFAKSLYDALFHALTHHTSQLRGPVSAFAILRGHLQWEHVVSKGCGNVCIADMVLWPSDAKPGPLAPSDTRHLELRVSLDGASVRVRPATPPPQQTVRPRPATAPSLPPRRPTEPLRTLAGEYVDLAVEALQKEVTAGELPHQSSVP